MTATVYLFARAVHAQRRAVPSGAVPAPPGTVAATHPTRPQAGVGGGLYRRPQSVSHIARPVALITTSPAAVENANSPSRMAPATSAMVTVASIERLPRLAATFNRECIPRLGSQLNTIDGSPV